MTTSRLTGRNYPRDPSVRTTQLGQFSDEHAEVLAGKLESAGISWWFKQPGTISQIWEWGVRLYVDRDRLDEARALAQATVEPNQATCRFFRFPRGV